MPGLNDCRDYFQAEYAKLPEIYKNLENPARYPVSLSAGLKTLQSQVEQRIRQRELGES